MGDHAVGVAVPDRRLLANPAESDGASSWTDRALDVLTSASMASVVVLGWRAWHQQQRYASLHSARAIDVEHIGSWFDAQAKLQESAYGHHHSAPLPPQYLSIAGRTACANPIMTQYATPAVPSIWYSKLETKTFLKLFPFTRLKMVHQEDQAAFFETREFQLVASRTATPPTVAATSTAATAASSSAAPAPSVSLPPPPSVSIPSTLPADPLYFRGLLREVADVVRDVSMSSSDFLRSLEQGRVHAKERNIERVVPVGQQVTVVGWVSRDAQGNLAVLSGQRTGAGATLPATLATQVLLPRGATQVVVHSETNPTTHASIDAHSSLLQQPDLQAYSYSPYDHPCIITHKSHARLLEDERAALSSSKKLLWISVGITVTLAVVLLGRYAWVQWSRHAELRRLLDFHAARKERRDAKVQERKGKERRRREKLKQRQQAKEMAQLKQAQIEYFNAAAAAAAAAFSHTSSSLPSQQPGAEGVPSSSLSYGGPGSPSPRANLPLRPSCSPVTVPTGGGGIHYSSRSGSPFPTSHLPPRPPVDQLLSRQSSATAPPASSSSTWASASASAYDEDSASSLDLASEPDDAASPHTDSDDASEDGTSMCIICAEFKADACMLPCAHLFTCTLCASKVTQCPVCRKHIEKIVKVFSQQL